MISYLLIAAAAAISPVVPAATQTPGQAIVVDHSDLDLSRPRDVATLDRRIDRAAAEVCGPATSYDLEGLNMKARCVRETVAVVRPMRNQVVAVASNRLQANAQ